MIGSVSEFQQQLAAQKRKKDRGREPLTPAHAADEAALAAECSPAGRCDSEPVTGEDARKAIASLEAEPGPGRVMQPGHVEPEQFDRPYLEADHPARSPLALEPLPQSAVAQVVGSGPAAAGMAAHQARVSATSPVIPVPRGSA